MGLLNGMVGKRVGVALVLSVTMISGRVAASGIYAKGAMKATPMPSGNTWSTTNSVFVGDASNGLVRLSTGQQWNLEASVSGSNQ